MLIKSTAHLSHAGKIIVGVAALSGLVACGGGGGSTSAGNTPPPAATDLYTGKFCGAVSNGSSEGYVLGVCDVVTQGLDGSILESSNNAFQAVVADVGSGKASPSIAGLSGKSLSIRLETSFDPIVPVGSLSYPGDYDNCTYYFSFDNVARSTNRPFTLSKLETINGARVPIYEISSFASPVPGINGPVAPATVGPCNNKTAEASIESPAVALTDFDFGVFAYYVGARRGKIDPAFYGGWYSRVGGNWTTPPTSGPAGAITFDASKSRVFGHYSSPDRLFNVSAQPISARWSNGELTGEIASWRYFNINASSSSGAGVQTYSVLNPRLPNLTLSGTYNSTTKKVEGKITGTNVQIGKFEGEFNSAGTEFVGRMTVKISGFEARMAGAFALRL